MQAALTPQKQSQKQKQKQKPSQNQNPTPTPTQPSPNRTHLPLKPIQPVALHKLAVHQHGAVRERRRYPPQVARDGGGGGKGGGDAELLCEPPLGGGVEGLAFVGGLGGFGRSVGGCADKGVGISVQDTPRPQTSTPQSQNLNPQTQKNRSPIDRCSAALRSHCPGPIFFSQERRCSSRRPPLSNTQTYTARCSRPLLWISPRSSRPMTVQPSSTISRTSHSGSAEGRGSRSCCCARFSLSSAAAERDCAGRAGAATSAAAAAAAVEEDIFLLYLNAESLPCCSQQHNRPLPDSDNNNNSAAATLSAHC